MCTEIDCQDRTGQSHGTVACCMALSTLLRMIQQTSVVNLLSVDWQEPVLSLLGFVALFTSKIEILIANCIFKSTPLGMVIGQVCLLVMSACTLHPGRRRILLPLQCEYNPNGRWSVRAYPSVICWELKYTTSW